MYCEKNQLTVYIQQISLNLLQNRDVGQESQDQMEEAIKKVRDGEMTAYRAHKTFGIPKQTLSDRLTV